MSFPPYYDPHYRPDRTAAAYEAEKRRDAVFAKENAAFVAEYLQNWSGGKIKESASEAFKRLRIEARRNRIGKKKNTVGKKALKKKLRAEKQDRKTLPANPRSQSALAPGADKSSSAEKSRIRKAGASSFPRARFELDSSVKYLSYSGEQLLLEYAAVQEKIGRWRDQYDVIDGKRRMQLATQLQIQYIKRRDLMALISYRLWD